VLVVAIAVIAYMAFGDSSSSTADSATGAAPATSGESAPAAAAETAQAAPATPIEIFPDDRILGGADAPVTIVEYASMTCPHCARFHIDTLPKVKSEFIDTGKVRLVFRDFPLDKVALSASLLAQCVQGDAYFYLLDVLFRSQADWSRADDPVVALRQIGRTAGLEEAVMDQCMNDQATIDRIVARFKEASEKLAVNSTPTLFINGVIQRGGLPFDDYEADGAMQPGFKKLIESHLPAQ
jgi:protein-disulfide isomerase